MGQNYHLVHHLWPSIPWYLYQSAYRATIPLLNRHGSPQRLGIFETAQDFTNFLYDILLGIRSHSRYRSKLRWLAAITPGFSNRRRLIRILHRTSVGPR
jgi:beta-carotene hydroxylase